MAQARHTSKEHLVEKLKRLRLLSSDDPYKMALCEVLIELSGMACETAGNYTPIWREDV